MRKVLTLLSAALLLAACSTPKYTYHFDYYDYNSGKKKSTPTVSPNLIGTNSSPETLVVDKKTLVASANENTVYVTEEKPLDVSKEEIADKIKALSKEERKDLKKQIKKYVKENRKGESVNSATSTNKLSGDLKLAAIFGLAGIILMIVLGDLFWLGTIAFLIGLFFLIRYLINH